MSLLAFSASASAGVIYVDHSALGTGDGSSWANAYPSLRAALDNATSGDDLWVAQGTYTPGPSAAASDSFFLKSGVRLYGGFAGAETSVAQRDWVLHPTILSGDVDGDDSIVGWPSFNINGRNSAHVLTGNGADSSALVDGFSIGHGHTGPSGTPAGASEMAGSGLYNVSSHPTITHCIFEYNTSAWAWGAAIYNLDSNPTITHCTFRYNAVHLSSGVLGNLGTSQPVIEDCEFHTNQATTGSGGQEAQGAAIANGWDSPPITIERCLFRSNSAKQFYSSGSGVEQARGGAISSFSAGLLVKDCIFRNNSANAGGALFAWGQTTIVNCLFEGNNVYNMITSGITQSGYGSALGIRSNSGEVSRLVNSAILNNNVVLGESGAVSSGGTGVIEISNSILWGNSAPPPASPRKKHYRGDVVLSHNTIENLFVPDASDPVQDPADIPGCIDLDPLFVNPAGDNYRLSAGSPAIDAGLNLSVPGLANRDLDGLDRVALGASSFSVDMGPYEYGSVAPGPCPSLVNQPQALTVVVGAGASFQVLAQGLDLSYQWRKDGQQLADGGTFAGVNTAALTLTGTSAQDAGAYDVVVSNGCSSLVSSAALLSVDPAPLGSVVCSGDGEGQGCPCGNDKDPGEGCENSIGEGGRLTGSGSASLQAADAFLHTDHLPANKSALYFMGSSLLNGGLGNPFGDGLLCTLPIKRFAVQSSGAAGEISMLDPASLAPGQIAAGVTRVFQVWYRDPAGPCGSGWNTSNAYRVTFQP